VIGLAFLVISGHETFSNLQIIFGAASSQQSMDFINVFLLLLLLMFLF
jgi:hypothetical protein